VAKPNLHSVGVILNLLFLKLSQCSQLSLHLPKTLHIPQIYPSVISTLRSLDIDFRHPGAKQSYFVLLANSPDLEILSAKGMDLASNQPLPCLQGNLKQFRIEASDLDLFSLRHILLLSPKLEEAHFVDTWVTNNNQQGNITDTPPICLPSLEILHFEENGWSSILRHITTSALQIFSFACHNESTDNTLVLSEVRDDSSLWMDILETYGHLPCYVSLCSALCIIVCSVQPNSKDRIEVLEPR
jgi:hypothetical protein